jgi:hypothetical protein
VNAFARVKLHLSARRSQRDADIQRRTRASP